jgi:outer membrane protein assembly factor BamE (lipoprotein component of BamABCDE complex)
MAFAAEMEPHPATVNARGGGRRGGSARRRRAGATGSAIAALVVASSALALAGCSLFEAPVIQRGHRVSSDLIQDIKTGVHTRSDVQSLIGSPTSVSTFGVENWYYISSKTRQRPARALAVSDQETVAVEFDGAGVVRDVRVLTENDMRPVDMVSRTTPSPGTERTLLQALFGNIGRFGPAATGAAPAAPTGGL